MKAMVFGASGGIGAALAQALAERGCSVLAGSRSGNVPADPRITPFTFDLDDESTTAAAAVMVANDRPDLVIVATGVLTLPDGTGPERTMRALDSAAMERMFALNTIGPAMIAKAILPVLPRERRSVFAALSARVGSISDNRLGGWHSYRASKAALNMLLRNFAIEMARTHPLAVVAGLHPGTVESHLSAPFARNLPDGQMTAPAAAAAHLLAVIDELTPEHSGGVFDWRGDAIPA